jgi:hypothetical protein
MRKIVLHFCLLMFTLCLCQRAIAQENTKPQEAPKASENAPTSPVHYYHLEYVIQELGADNKPVNSRTYTTTISTGSHEWISVRTGSRIPVSTGPNQSQFVDVGINIDARDAHEVGRQLALNLTADVSSFASTTDESIHQPVIRQNKWQASVLIPVGKLATVFASDSIDSKGKLQLIVTATPLQ